MRRLLVAIFVGVGISVFGYAHCLDRPAHFAHWQDPEAASKLDVRIELREKNGLAGNVILRNTSKYDLRVLRMENRFGDRTLSFVLIAKGRAYHISWTSRDFLTPPPEYETLAPGEEYKFAFDLTDERYWDQTWKPVLSLVGRGQLAALYEADSKPPQSRRPMKWGGAIGSSLVDVRYTSTER